MANTKYYGTGRRKKSIARVYLVPGTGKITINKRDIDEYLGLETLKVVVRQPLVATETVDKLTFSLTYVVVDTQDRQEQSVTESQEHFLKQILITDRYLRKPDTLHVTHV